MDDLLEADFWPGSGRFRISTWSILLAALPLKTLSATWKRRILNAPSRLAPVEADYGDCDA
jgi:hypothetical protein